MTTPPAAHPVQAGDGHAFTLLHVRATSPRLRLLWLPALGVTARHYLPFAEALAARGVDVHLHEWRGSGSSTLRAGRGADWGYRTLLSEDLPASLAAIAALWLVASGTPYWRSFPHPLRHALPLVYRFLPWLARRLGVLPGRRLGFGGNEAPHLIADWARVGLTDRYVASGMAQDLDAGMAHCNVPVQGIVLADDWMAPASSLQRLVARLGTGTPGILRLDAHALGTRADHFAWMRAPAAVADALLDGMRQP